MTTVQLTLHITLMFWRHTFNGTRVVQSLQLPATGWTVLWLKPGRGGISFSSQTGPDTDPAASTVGKNPLTSGLKRPEHASDYSFPCRAEIKHQYSCTSEELLCQSWLVMG